MLSLQSYLLSNIVCYAFLQKKTKKIGPKCEKVHFFPKVQGKKKLGALDIWEACDITLDSPKCVE